MLVRIRIWDSLVPSLPLVSALLPMARWLPDCAASEALSQPCVIQTAAETQRREMWLSEGRDGIRSTYRCSRGRARPHRCWLCRGSLVSTELHQGCLPSLGAGLSGDCAQCDVSTPEDRPSLPSSRDPSGIVRAHDRRVLENLDACASWAPHQQGDPERLGLTGFCWGGRIAWLYAAFITCG